MSKPKRATTMSAMSSTASSSSIDVKTDKDRPSTRSRIDAAVAAELIAMKKVLVNQQEDNRRYQDHVKLLGSEIDQMKVIIEKKQDIINSKSSEIFRRDETIKDLEAKLHDALMDKTAFKVLETQNVELCEKIVKKQSEYDKVLEELNKLKACQDDIRAVADNKIKSIVEVEVNLTASVMELKHKVDMEHSEKVSALKQAYEHKVVSTDLKNRLKLSEDIRRDQVSRSRRTEYNTLRRIDELTLSLADTRDEKNKLQETLNLSNFRADLLQDRLDETITNSHENETLLNTMINEVEDSMDTTRIREKRLIRLNENLQAKLQITQKAFNQLLKQHNKLDSIVKYAQDHGFPGFEIIDMSKKGGSKDSMYKKKSANKTSEMSEMMRQLRELETTSMSILGLEPMAADSSISILPNIAKEDYDKVYASACKTTSGPGKQADASNSIITINVDSAIQQGKQCLLSKYLEFVTQQYRKNSLNSAVIDLSRSAISDEEFTQIIEWFRLIPSFLSVKKIDIHGNILTDASFHMLCIWLISLPSTEYVRDDVLEIDLKHNMVTKEGLLKAVHDIKRTSRKEIKNIYIENDTSIVIYCSQSVLDEPVAVMRIDTRYNKPKITKIEDRSHLRIDNPVNEVENCDVDLLIEKHLAVYPRDGIFKEHSLVKAFTQPI